MNLGWDGMGWDECVDEWISFVLLQGVFRSSDLENVSHMYLPNIQYHRWKYMLSDNGMVAFIVSCMSVYMNIVI